MNHLRARRRTRALTDIQDGKFPVILEIDRGRNFVILKEEIGEASFLVQFPDSRESVVTRARLEEVYDGVCIFLNPKKRGGGESGQLEGNRTKGFLGKWFRREGKAGLS
tara:strand:+ start:2189 stop:2515 length:327 start_codon:yes stop_codon:yes gene_type:complete